MGSCVRPIVANIISGTLRGTRVLPVVIVVASSALEVDVRRDLAQVYSSANLSSNTTRSILFRRWDLLIK